MAKYNILILGASYGSLLASKMLFGGHSIRLICLPAEADLINAEGFRVRLPRRRVDAPVELDSRKLPGRVTASGTVGVDPRDYDLVGLAMQEPQYGSPGVRGLMKDIAASGVPCMSIMNMAPLPYMRRISGLNSDALLPSFTDPEVWADFNPGKMTLCSPDPQAIRPPGHGVNVLQVTLPTNFKVARFDDERCNDILRQLEHDIDSASLDGPEGPIELPVKLRFHESLFVPLAKWAMLMAGNYRCITDEGMCSVQEAVHANLEESRSIYNFVIDVCVKVGAARADLVPFEKYAAAAASLSRPASAARAVSTGAVHIERADKLVRLVAGEKGMSHPILDAIVARVDRRLAANRTRRAGAGG